MKKSKFNMTAGIVKIVFSILFLTAYTGCIYKPQSIKGEVVDETGAPMSGVDVSACYSGCGFKICPPLFNGWNDRNKINKESRESYSIHKIRTSGCSSCKRG